MLKYRLIGRRGVVAAACILTMALIGPSGAQQQQGGGGAGPGAGTSAGPTGGMTNRPGGGAASRRADLSPRARAERNRRVAAAARARSRPRVGVRFGYSGGCGFLARRARATGSPYWWRRFRACRGW
jgi:hypothetical protein